MNHQPDTGASFRDTLGIVSKEGKRHWIYPRQPSGFYYRLRTIFSGVLLLLFFCVPLLTFNDHPFMLFDVMERRFIIFGSAFGPQDFYLFVIGMITLIVFALVFTVVFGRIFCGWICPQTVFMEMIFRRIDYWLEGNHRQHKTAIESPRSTLQTFRKLTKYAIYIAVAFSISSTLLAWSIGAGRVWTIITDPHSSQMAGWMAMLGLTGFFTWIFAWFREQACILICPYGRLQGVLLDKNTIVIAYDHVRGEPRGRIRRNQTRTEGDCIDCNLCVEVCPTGIDIRNGTQLECVNCTACIDTCDAVMMKTRKPRGLVRYDSANGISGKRRSRWTGRVLGSGTILVALVSTLTVLLINRHEVDVTILRTPGMFFQEQPDGRMSNVYDVKVLNKTFSPVPVLLVLQNPRGEIRTIGAELIAPPQGMAETKLMIILNRDDLRGMSTPLQIGVSRDGKILETVSTSFLGPGRQK